MRTQFADPPGAVLDRDRKAPVGGHYGKALASGKVEAIGDLGLVPVETWIYPAYVEEMCPGLPDWEALNACADIFATPETLPKGRFLDYPADWGDQQRGPDRGAGPELRLGPGRQRGRARGPGSKPP